MTGHLCPECGTPRGAEGRAGPGCVCAEGAEVSAAEVFDPLRVRPYVTLQNVAESGAAPDGDTVPLPRVVDAVPHDEPDALGPDSLGPDSLNLDALDPVDLTRVDLTPVRHRGRPRSYKGLMVVAAALTVAGTAAFAGGLFSGDDEREKALPDRGTSAPSVSMLPDTPTSSPTRSRSASASPSGTASPEQSSSPAPADSSAPAAPSAPPPTTAQATASVSVAPQTQGSGTLRSGDSGPAVVELQQRLAKLLLYTGPMDGEYDQSVEDSVRFFQNSRKVKGDPRGVYGPKTRRALEAETQ